MNLSYIYSLIQGALILIDALVIAVPEIAKKKIVTVMIMMNQDEKQKANYQQLDIIMIHAGHPNMQNCLPQNGTSKSLMLNDA